MTPSWTRRSSKREDGDLTVLTAAVRRWWFEADAWRDPKAQLAFLARVDGYVAQGPPPPEERMSWQQFRGRPVCEVAYRWEFDGPARLDAESLSEHVRQELDRFMEAVTILDLAGYGRAPRKFFGCVSAVVVFLAPG